MKRWRPPQKVPASGYVERAKREAEQAAVVAEASGPVPGDRLSALIAKIRNVEISRRKVKRHK